MKLQITLLASAIAAATVMTAGAQAATPPSLLTRIYGTASSDATFAGGASVSAGANYLKVVPASADAGVYSVINVPAGDVGTEGDLYQVIQVSMPSGTSWYQRTPAGFTAWTTLRVADLVPFQTRNLEAREVISIDDIESDLGMSLNGANVRVHVGYTNDANMGSLIYSQAVAFDIAAAPSSSSCPANAPMRSPVTLAGNNLCVLSGTYTSDLHLTSNFDYVLSGGVFIGGDNANSAALTIDAGTTLYGESGADFLVINRGSRIHANGSPNAPIIMTSANDSSATASTRGQWGGLIINGNAPINGCTVGTTLCEAQGEGSTGSYGGNDPDDDSGNLNYLQVRYAGYEITAENELNGIAFQAVGSGTNVDYVQVHNNSDDGVEFFGGTVNAKHLVLTGNSDDSLDWVLGWQGKVQHVLIFQTDEGDQGFESDNLDTARDSLPRSKPTIANATLVGNANTDLGMLLREGTAGNFANFVVTGFGDACVDIDHSATFANAGSSAASLTGELTMTHSIVDCDTNFDEEVDDNWSVASWFTNQAGNEVGGVSLTDGYINSAAINALPAADLSDSFFDEVDYIGAVPDTARDWTLGWTFRQFENFQP